MLPNFNKRDLQSYTVPIIAISVFALGALFLVTRKKTFSSNARLADSKKLVVFVPTDDWQIVQKYHICPPGLKYKVDMNTGVNLAKK